MTVKQWIGLGVTLVVVAGVHLCVYLTRSRLNKQNEETLFVMLPEYEQAFEMYVDSVEDAERKQRYSSYRHSSVEIVMQPFDPNTADSSLLVSVGLRPWMAKNLIRYREAGKIFRKADDLKSLYGMNDSLFAAIQPFVQIDTTIIDSLSGHYRSIHGPSSGVITSTSVSHPKCDTIIELNSADTSALQFIRGIGLYTAIRIIQYRDQLGGYYSVNQLYEIAEIPADRTDSLLPHLTVDTSLIVPLPVNQASVKRLYRHPYISYRQAEQVYDHRRRKIRLNGIEDLSGIFTADELRRLMPYLQFE